MAKKIKWQPLAKDWLDVLGAVETLFCGGTKHDGKTPSWMIRNQTIDTFDSMTNQGAKLNLITGEYYCVLSE